MLANGVHPGSTRTIKRQIKQGLLPEPELISERLKAWRAPVIRKAIDDLPRVIGEKKAAGKSPAPTAESAPTKRGPGRPRKVTIDASA
jgi:hypothetical protein